MFLFGLFVWLVGWLVRFYEEILEHMRGSGFKFIDIKKNLHKKTNKRLVCVCGGLGWGVGRGGCGCGGGGMRHILNARCVCGGGGGGGGAGGRREVGGWGERLNQAHSQRI